MALYVPPAFIVPPVWPQGKPTPVTVRHMQTISQDLLYLDKDATDTKQRIDFFPGQPDQFVAVPAVSFQGGFPPRWVPVYYNGQQMMTILRPYTEGHIVVFVNGLLRRPDVDWVEATPSAGYIGMLMRFNPAEDDVVVWDWSTTNRH